MVYSSTGKSRMRKIFHRREKEEKIIRSLVNTLEPRVTKNRVNSSATLTSLRILICPISRRIKKKKGEKNPITIYIYIYRGCVNSILREQFVPPLPSARVPSNFHSSHLAHITSATYARCDLHWVTGFVGGIMGSVRAPLIVPGLYETKYNRRVVQLLRDPRISPRLFERWLTGTVRIWNACAAWG